MSIVSDSAPVAASPIVKTLLAGVVDYAGLFPPAELPMTDAIDHYAANRETAGAWMLNRFILPAGRLSEFAAAFAKLPAEDRSNWKLSVLLGTAPAADLKHVAAFNARGAGAEVVAVEAKVSSHAEISRLVKLVASTFELWVEVPGGPSVPVHELATPHCGAKIRLGGMDASAFPSPMHVATFMRGCHEARVRFKATAGLHHPVGGTYAIDRKTPDVTVRMFGFLNVLLAATLIVRGGTVVDAVALLTEDDPSAFRSSGDAVRWRDRWFGDRDIAVGRKFMPSFGSCSFLEPCDGLHEMQWL